MWRAALVPGGARGRQDAAYDAFAAAHGRTHASEAVYRWRLGAYRANMATIAAHNARPGRAYSMAPNRYADWTEVPAPP